MHHRQRLAVGTTLVTALIAPLATSTVHADPAHPPESATTTGTGPRHAPRHQHKGPDRFIGAGGDSAALAARLQRQAKGRKITQLDVDTSAVALTADGTLLAAGREPDVADMLRQSRGRRITQVSTADGVMAALTATGRPIVADPKRRITAPDLLSQTRGHKITQITVAPGGVLALTNDGRLHLAGETGWTKCLMDQARGKKVTSIAGGHGFLALAKGGDLMASGAQSGEILKQAEGKRVVRISGGPSSSALASDGTYVSTSPKASKSLRRQAAGRKFRHIATAHREFLAVTGKSTFLLHSPYGKKRAWRLTKRAAGRPVAHVATDGHRSLAVVRETAAQPSAVRTYGDTNRTAEAKTSFGHLRAQALDGHKPVGGTDLKFRIIGRTAARFIVGGRPRTSAIATTARDGADKGWAKAPTLLAGGRPGGFSIKITSISSPSATPGVYFMHVTEASEPDQVRLKFADMKANPQDGPVKLQLTYRDRNNHRHIRSIMPGRGWIRFDGQNRLKIPIHLTVKQLRCPYRELSNGGVLAIRAPQNDRLILTRDPAHKLPAHMAVRHVKDTNEYVFTWRGTPKHGPARVAKATKANKAAKAAKAAKRR
ncbi:hypothetical protein AB0A77_03065 [Streptomyces varsoviensis]|uniref:hypothetical protein n=1 Tax=Streptomyces varsoviensis TaxID=67373 RepID=UPI0033C3523B